ncbi:MAG: transcriptional regulator [Mucilaginibacter sp.]|uniref:winged helix-turn-helix transcriptional regulator n=1 Tax=Mucilaginibacter sp. TaxID=1882438 RepID=UPI00261F3FD8|nr:helix-turn-helix domain-containing protein [Mucilaginibacter sp.]MDB5001988.1 transcriptional regulator [Mucilaginibacter sp.]
MTAIKESSTQNMNKSIAEMHCPVTYVMNRIGGHWKPIIMYQLINGAKRYSELKRAIPAVTEKMLIQHLKQLEADNLIIRKAEPVVPPFVTYTLSPSGEDLTPVMTAMVEWAKKDSKILAEKFAEVDEVM